MKRSSTPRQTSPTVRLRHGSRHQRPDHHLLGRQAPERGGISPCHADSFKVVVFTARLHEYASLVLDCLDQDDALFTQRSYHGTCRDARDDRLVKDLAAFGHPPNHTVITDDNPNTNAL
jgi:hypothetical protein